MLSRRKRASFGLRKRNSFEVSIPMGLRNRFKWTHLLDVHRSVSKTDKLCRIAHNLVRFEP